MSDITNSKLVYSTRFDVKKPRKRIKKQREETKVERVESNILFMIKNFKDEKNR